MWKIIKGGARWEHSPVLDYKVHFYAKMFMTASEKDHAWKSATVAF